MAAPLKPPTGATARVSSTPKLQLGETPNPILATTVAGGRNRTSIAPSGSKGPLRGIILPNRGAASTAASSPSVSNLSPEWELTPEEQLEIMERLEKGQFSTDVGWSQFLEPVKAKRDKAKNPADPALKHQQDLAGTFATLDLNQTGRSNISIKLVQGQVEGHSEGPVQNTTNNAANDPDLPLWMIRLEQLLDSVDAYKAVFEKTISALLEAQFAEYIPPDKFARFMEKMDVAMKNLKFLTEHKYSDTTRLIFKNSPPKKANLPCPLEDQEDFIASMGALSENLKKLGGFFGNPYKEIDLEKMVENYNKLLDEMDDDLIRTEDQLKEVEHYSELMRKYMKKYENDELSSSESSWSEGEEESENEGQDLDGNKKDGHNSQEQQEDPGTAPLINELR